MSYDIYLTVNTDDSAHPQEIPLGSADWGRVATFEFCASLQPYLRDGVEAHFATADPASSKEQNQ